MGLIERLQRMQRVGKKQCSRVYRRIRAATKTGRRKRVRFQYDPYSYAMNFDDGLEREMREKEASSYESCAERRRRILVYVVFLK